MDKKAIMGSAVIVPIIMAIAAILILAAFLGHEGLLPKIADATDSFQRFLPGKAKTEIPNSADASKDIKEKFETLYQTLMSSKAKYGCLEKYNSLDLGKNKIKIDYIEAEKELYLKLMDSTGAFLEDYSISNVKPCVVLPADKGGIVGVALINNVIISSNNEISFNGQDNRLFKDHPVLYKPKKSYYGSKVEDWTCFFADWEIAATMPNGDSKVYGGTFFNNGLDESDIKDMESKTTQCEEVEPDYCIGPQLDKDKCIEQLKKFGYTILSKDDLTILLEYEKAFDIKELPDDVQILFGMNYYAHNLKVMTITQKIFQSYIDKQQLSKSLTEMQHRALYYLAKSKCITPSYRLSGGGSSCFNDALETYNQLLSIGSQDNDYWKLAHYDTGMIHAQLCMQGDEDKCGFALGNLTEFKEFAQESSHPNAEEWQKLVEKEMEITDIDGSKRYSYDEAIKELERKINEG